MGFSVLKTKKALELLRDAHDLKGGSSLSGFIFEHLRGSSIKQIEYPMLRVFSRPEKSLEGRFEHSKATEVFTG